MSSVRTSPWPAGFPCWADLTAPDVRTATDFYAAVLGWQFDDPDADYGGYAMARVDGHTVAGVGPQMQFGVPAAWTLYFATADIDATAKAITGAGGTMLLPPGDVGDRGRLLIAADPSQAVFGCWQAGASVGAELVNAPGALTWEDLRSTDPQAAWAFYSSVFGHRLDDFAAAGGDYKLFAVQGDQAPLGGMGGTFGTDRPSHWLVYFGVTSVVEAVTAAERAGGQVLQPAFDTPFGTMAGLADPAGAGFMIAETDPSRQPDRSG